MCISTNGGFKRSRELQQDSCTYPIHGVDICGGGDGVGEGGEGVGGRSCSAYVYIHAQTTTERCVPFM